MRREEERRGVERKGAEERGKVVYVRGEYGRGEERSGCKRRGEGGDGGRGEEDSITSGKQAHMNKIALLVTAFFAEHTLLFQCVHID